MTGLGTFEIGKGLAMEVREAAPLAVALAAGVLAAGLVVHAHARRTGQARALTELRAAGK
jgi:hypothetical protein